MLDTVEYGVTHVVAASDGTDKAKAARKTPGCVLVKPGWLMECYWSMTCRDVEPFLIGKGQGEIPEQSLQGVTKESNTDNSIDGSNESEDDDFAAEFEDELLT
jgi:RNA polymerase II subunit A-like phosphatase